MSVPERRLAILIMSWRDIADGYESGARGTDDSLETREAVAHAYRLNASMLEQAAMLCAVCTGRGFEFSPAFEDEPEGWFTCSMCKESGIQPHRGSCARCANVELLSFMREVDDELLCFGCAAMQERFGKDREFRVEPPFGPRRFF